LCSEVIAKSADDLENLDIMHEKKIIQNFIKELIKDKGLASYGENEVRNNLIIGAVDTLILSEDLSSMRKKFVCSSCESEKEITVKTQAEADKLQERCPNCNEVMKEESSVDLVDELVEKAEEMNANIEFVSTETEEGMQLFRAFGGIAAILRYYVEY
jgi:peptide chain release factor subunit 1